MKFNVIPIFLVSALTTAVTAQESSTNAPSSLSGLQIEIRTDEERIQFLLKVADAYFSEKDYESAINAYERILKIDPKNKQARYIIGHVYINAKQYAKAEDHLSSLIEDFPDDFQLKNNLAWLYATAEDSSIRDGKKAVKIAQEAMVNAPNDHHVWSTLAEAHYISGEYEKAYRAITHMAQLASRYGKSITKEQVEGYNVQILKCKRAWDAQLLIEDDTAEDKTESP